MIPRTVIGPELALPTDEAVISVPAFVQLDGATEAISATWAIRLVHPPQPPDVRPNRAQRRAARRRR